MNKDEIQAFLDNLHKGLLRYDIKETKISITRANESIKVYKKILKQYQIKLKKLEEK